jgi:hypothetical protein
VKRVATVPTARTIRRSVARCLPMLAALLTGPTLGSLASAAEAPDPSRIAVLAQAQSADDADDFGGLQARGGLLLDYQSPLQYAGFAAQSTRYSQDGWSEDVVGVGMLYRNQRRNTLEGLNAEAGLVSVGGKARPVGDVTWTLRPRESTGVELIAAGDIVGTREAIERAISYGLVGASVEQQFGERWTGIGLVGWQPFTDGNARALLRARFIYALLPEQGLSAQVRWRGYSSREDDVQGAYFNPERYRNWDAGFAWRRRFGTWVVAGLAGAGRERIDEESWRTTGLAELRTEGPVAGDSHLSVGLAYNRAAGFNAADDYWYGALNVSLIVPLR